MDEFATIRFMREGARRFEAQWVSKQHIDSTGEYIADLDEYGSSYHCSREAAERAAIASGKRADQAEWIMVAEQEYQHGEWHDISRWTGDYDGLHENTFIVEVEA